MRDDSTGGWVPMGGGGLSNVSVRKRKIQHEDDQPCKHEYFIHGKRISDQSVSINEIFVTLWVKLKKTFWHYFKLRFLSNILCLSNVVHETRYFSPINYYNFKPLYKYGMPDFILCVLILQVFMQFN